MDKAERLQLLELKHKEADALIQKGWSKYLNDEKLSLMKKEKLHLKDQIEALKNELSNSEI